LARTVESPEAKKGLETLDKSFSQTEEVWWLAEQNRLCARLLLFEPGTRTEAETVLRATLEMARSQKSKSLELRVTVCLARLLRHQRPLPGIKIF